MTVSTLLQLLAAVPPEMRTAPVHIGIDGEWEDVRCVTLIPADPTDPDDGGPVVALLPSITGDSLAVAPAPAAPHVVVYHHDGPAPCDCEEDQ